MMEKYKIEELQNLQIAPNFWFKEYIESPAIESKYYNSFWESLNDEIVENLINLCRTVDQPWRTLSGVPLVITCGFRPVRYEKEKGRSGNSQHAKGLASDKTQNSEYLQLMHKVMNPYFVGGFKYYKKENFAHADKRGFVARW